MISAKFTLDELDELAGYVAAEANNTKDKKLQKAFDVMSDAIDELNLAYSVDTGPAQSVLKQHLSLVKK